MRFSLRARLALAAALFGALLAVNTAAAQSADRHAGYYYPEPTTETYLSRAQTLTDSTRETRVAFVTGLTSELLSRPYAPQYSVFAKGDLAEKLIIISLNDSALATLYQGRALLAQLTAIARTTPFFREMAVEDFFTFFDLCKLLGFSRITISDGRTYAHQIVLQ